MPAVGRAGSLTRRRKGRLEGVQLTCSFLCIFHSVIQTLGRRIKVVWSQKRVGTWAMGSSRAQDMTSRENQSSPRSTAPRAGRLEGK